MGVGKTTKCRKWHRTNSIKQMSQEHKGGEMTSRERIRKDFTQVTGQELGREERESFLRASRHSIHLIHVCLLSPNCSGNALGDNVEAGALKNTDVGDWLVTCSKFRAVRRDPALKTGWMTHERP